MTTDEKIALLMRGYRVSYEYESLPADFVAEAIAFVDDTKCPDAYLTESPELTELKRILKGGFRWVFTENGRAIFERPLLHVPEAS